jgi:hypothetical protein
LGRTLKATVTPTESPIPVPRHASTVTRDQPTIAALRTHIEHVAVQNALCEQAALLARVTELERRLGLNRSNSNKPPSSGGPKKPPRTRDPRERSKKTSDDPPNYPGTTLSAVANTDHIVDHFASNRDNRAPPLPRSTGRSHVPRQVFDLPGHQDLRGAQVMTSLSRPACPSSPRPLSLQGGKRRGNLHDRAHRAGDCGVAALLAMTGAGNDRGGQ